MMGDSNFEEPLAQVGQKQVRTISQPLFWSQPLIIPAPLVYRLFMTTPSRRYTPLLHRPRNRPRPSRPRCHCRRRREGGVEKKLFEA
jgi:hypothetical protein